MSADRVPYPPGLQQRLRHEACFGCCICGGPLLQYHHIIPYAERAKTSIDPAWLHDPDHMVVVCPTCHIKIGGGAYSEAEQRDHKASPFNARRGLAEGELYVGAGPPVLQLGVTKVENRFAVIVDRVPVFDIAFTSAQGLNLNFTITNDDGSEAVRVRDNQWESGPVHPWDIKHEPSRLLIRSKNGVPVLGIDARDRHNGTPVRIKARLAKNGVYFEATENRMLFEGCDVGMTNLGGASNVALLVNTTAGKVAVGIIGNDEPIQPWIERLYRQPWS